MLCSMLDYSGFRKLRYFFNRSPTCGCLYLSIVQGDYFLRHPAGVYPVLLNDVVFSVNAAIAQTITVIQCFVLKVVDTLDFSMCCMYSSN